MNSDLARHMYTRKSVTYITLMLADGLNVYKSKPRPTIAHNTTKAKHTAARDCSKTTLYIRYILEEKMLQLCTQIMLQQ